MADDRPVEDATEQLARITTELKDLRETLLARTATRPTGDIEPALRIKPGTLLLNGQTVSRVTYAALWQFAQDWSLVIAGLFTVGDGSTTFGIPNFSGRFVVGAGTLGGDVYTVGGTGGSAFRQLITANLPSHDHNVSVNSGGGHDHGFGTNSSGSHNGHNAGSTGAASALAGSQDFFFSVASSTQNSNGSHSHSGTTDFENNHGHTVSESGAGSDTSFDNRPAYVGANWLVYT